jgi:hypothetical protein
MDFVIVTHYIGGAAIFKEIPHIEVCFTIISAKLISMMEVRFMAFDIIAALLEPLQTLFGGLTPLVVTVGPLTLLVLPLLLFI